MAKKKTVKKVKKVKVVKKPKPQAKCGEPGNPCPKDE